MITVPISAAQSLRSSPWVDYATDTMYVATDDGVLHKITPVFNGPGTSGEVTGPWPSPIQNASVFSSPVFDHITGNVFMGESTGHVYIVNVNSGARTSVAVGLQGAFNSRVLDTPIVDSTAGKFLATTSNDGTSAAVAQFPTSDPLNQFNQIARARIGLGSTTNTVVNLYGGDFDNTYFNSLGTGNMIVCGTGVADTIPTLYSLSYNTGQMSSTPTQLSQVSSSGTARCSPITEFFNSNIGPSGTDFFFLGVTNNCTGSFGLITGGCVMSLDSTGTPTAATAIPGGTSEIIPDNNSTQSQASSIDFTSQGAPNAAHKVTQQGLN
jgi:hypothetical protein